MFGTTLRLVDRVKSYIDGRSPGTGTLHIHAPLMVCIMLEHKFAGDKRHSGRVLHDQKDRNSLSWTVSRQRYSTTFKSCADLCAIC